MDESDEKFEEVEALQCIFCKDGEMTLEKEGQTYKVRILLLPDAGTNYDQFELWRGSYIQFLLPPTYPHEASPVICTAFPNLSHDIVQTVTHRLQQRAQDLLGGMMLLDLVGLAKELLEDARLHAQNAQCPNAKTEDKVDQRITSDFPTYSECDQGERYSSSVKSQPKDKSLSRLKHSQTRSVTALLRLDHMRSRSSYSKLIKKWAGELGLKGYLIFCHRLILILLQGSAENIKEYILRNRTTNVDVDSRGRSCKERMLSVLCEVPTDNDNASQLPEFSILELSGLEKLSELFQQLSLHNLFRDYVKPLGIIPGVIS